MFARLAQTLRSVQAYVRTRFVPRAATPPPTRSYAFDAESSFDPRPLAPRASPSDSFHFAVPRHAQRFAPLPAAEEAMDAAGFHEAIPRMLSTDWRRGHAAPKLWDADIIGYTDATAPSPHKPTDAPALEPSEQHWQLEYVSRTLHLVPETSPPSFVVRYWLLRDENGVIRRSGFLTDFVWEPSR